MFLPASSSRPSKLLVWGLPCDLIGLPVSRPGVDNILVTGKGISRTPALAGRGASQGETIMQIETLQSTCHNLARG